MDEKEKLKKLKELTDMMSVKVGNSVFIPNIYGGEKIWEHPITAINIDNGNIKIVYNGFSHPDLIRKDMELYVNGLLIQLHGEKE